MTSGLRAAASSFEVLNGREADHNGPSPATRLMAPAIGIERSNGSTCDTALPLQDACVRDLLQLLQAEYDRERIASQNIIAGLRRELNDLNEQLELVQPEANVMRNSQSSPLPNGSGKFARDGRTSNGGEYVLHIEGKDPFTQKASETNELQMAVLPGSVNVQGPGKSVTIADDTCSKSSDGGPTPLVHDSSMHFLGAMIIHKSSILRAYFYAWSRYAKSLHIVTPFSLTNVWESREKAEKAVMRHSSSHREALMDLSDADYETLHHSDDGNGCGLTPTSPARVCWDLIGAIMLAWDLFMIPVGAFQPPQEHIFVFMDWSTLIFWTWDMVMSLITGYVDGEGHLVMSKLSIWKNYLKAWFWIDCIVIVPDWIFTLMEVAGGSVDNTSAAETGKLLRGLRVVRIARLLRLAKLRKVISMVRDRIDSEFMFILSSIMRLIFLLFILTHLIACSWFGIGNLSPGVSWIEIEFDETTGIYDNSRWYKYLTSLHWSITQFTPGSMNVQPSNPFERCFSIVVLFFGMVFSSYFISSMTASVTQLKNMSSDKARQLWLLRRYLRHQRIESGLVYRVLRYVDYDYENTKKATEESRMLVMLSKQLQSEVRYQVSYSSMKAHPLFDSFSALSNITLYKLSDRALSMRSLAKGDLLFRTRSPSKNMYMVVSGSVQYLHTDTEKQIRLRKENWLSEQALWTTWQHRGDSQASEESKFIVIEATEFATVVQEDNVIFSLCSVYAADVLVWLNSTQQKDLTDAIVTEIKNGTLDKRRSRAIGYLHKHERETDEAPDRRGSSMSRISMFSFNKGA
eukprot:TRINITY_DN14953_c0_g2_i1.p1 TRINITY_DN14953_c0_g2~~TRINITY_DN14953_c0_g2_i1.p1  ORF type:complete len:801 (-),score=140.47 TRINITY_DN14953_c0_g2_i1:51-2453(-)